MRFSVPRAPRSFTALLLLSSTAALAGPGDWPNVDAHIAARVLGVLEEAADRLSRPACSAVLLDFDDGRTGRPLAETLSRTGLRPEEWLRSIYFLDGAGHRGCADRRTVAYTPNGAPVVFVCPVALSRYRMQDPSFAATVLIHEALHTLGLGENPPSSWAITMKVQERCGR